MKRKHKSYKLQDDSLETICRQFLVTRINAFRTSEKMKSLQTTLDDLEQTKKELEQKIIYLMTERNRHSLTVDRIKFTLEGNQLLIQFVLD